jgi:hypothetical protein
MKLRCSRLSVAAVILAVLAVLLFATAAFGQDSDNSAVPALLAGGMLMFILAIVAAVYVYMALALHTIATKTGTENPWLAWIPIVNLVLPIMIAKKPIWWIVLCFIPLVNLVILVIVWMEVAKARRKPDWLGILMIVPIGNLIVPGILAWTD